MNAVLTTDKEQVYPDNERLISTTDTRGIITYANPEFCRIAGYSQEELIGKQHSIVRHPDMPPAAFKDMWDHLKNNQPWMGLVKNRCKNGDYYWVQAYVMPLYDTQGHTTGYQSVRTRPSREQIDRAETIYRRIRERPPRAVKPSSLIRRVILISAGMGLLMLGSQFLPLSENLQLALMALTLITGLGLIHFSSQSFQKVSQLSQQVYNNPLAQWVMTESMQEPGAVELANRMMQARLRTVIGRMEDSIDTLSEVMAETNSAIAQTNSGIEQQNQESDMLASAATQMSATAHEIAQNTAQTSEATQHATDLAEQGRVNLDTMLRSIGELVKDVQAASQSSIELKQQTQAIEQILSIINDIAEQTNLLALNAAIEAARAGEQGRGFSVVADEVRTLAQRTQSSTSEIRNTVDQIHKQVEITAATMQRCSEQAEQGIRLAQDANQSFEQVSAAMTGVSDRCIQVASASEQQSSVSEEINNNVLNIRDIASRNLAASEITHNASVNLEKLVTELRSMLKTFSG
ncbi:methyl-accepting chemotaxis protein [Neptuniibacter halophilus]|uniref:methyl-accepting chemotaxis protein n=1 Tax=Neptuniibacter halophilus TaxID=651666 RepID=UPI0025746BE7|nr:PAS domain-containing methyl-accepting chemotaxis protein [Neptuniibacter halophilus]